VSHGGDTSRLPQNIQEEARWIKSDIEKRAARMEAGRDPSEETEADISPEEQERLDKDLEEKASKAKEEEEKKRQEKEKQEAEKKRQEEEARATDGEEEVPRTAAPGCELVNVEVEKTAEGTFTIDQNRLGRVLTNCQTDDQLLAEYQRHAFRIEEVLGAAHHASVVLLDAGEPRLVLKAWLEQNRDVYSKPNDARQKHRSNEQDVATAKKAVEGGRFSGSWRPAAILSVSGGRHES
jgi:hypothetical protein